MKIIAVINESHYGSEYVASVSSRELEIITGKSFNRGITPGMEIEVQKAWDDLQKFRAAANRLEGAAETLKAVAELTIKTTACYVVTPATPEEKFNE